MLTNITVKFACKSLMFIAIAIMLGNPAGQGAAAETAALAGKNAYPLDIAARVFVNNYIRENRETLEAVQLRSRSPFHMIEKVFKRFGLPQEVKYLAVIESELKATALSKVGARGPWQLMPETAQLLGLQVNADQDERILYYKSTVAAAKYLRDLYGEFGDWLLVFAAYNSGSAQVYRAMRKAHSRSFWDLQAYLPAESRMHVKKFIATHYFFEGKGGQTTMTKSAYEHCATVANAVQVAKAGNAGHSNAAILLTKQTPNIRYAVI